MKTNTLFNATKMLLSSMYTLTNGNILKSLTANIFSILNIAINLGSPFLLIQGLSVFNTPGDLGKLLWFLGGYGVAVGAGKILPKIRDMLLTSTGSTFSHRIANEVIGKFFELPMEHRATNTSAQEAQYFNNAYETIGPNSAKRLFGEIIPTLIEASIATGLLIRSYGYPVGLGLAGILGTYSCSALVGSNLVYSSHNNFLKHMFATYEKLVGLLEQYENAHYYNNVERERKDFDKELQKFDKFYDKKYLVTEAVSSVQHAISQFGLGGLLLYAAYQIKKGVLKIDDFFLIFVYGTQLANSLGSFAVSVNELYSSYACFKEISEYLNKENSFDKYKDPLIIQGLKAPTIEFRNICFSYNGKRVLNNISSNIPSGSKVAIVGLSGAGKSTIVKLLFRFYDLDSGNILVEGQDIRKVSLNSLRKHIAIVPQSPNIINDTIVNNIKYANPEAEDSEIKKAIEFSGLADILTQYGSNVPVGEKGAKISGGQKQRIALARAYIKNSPILILDEATTGLDKITEQQILKNFNLIAKGKTTFIITHKLETIKYVDKILLLKDGELIAEGTYKELKEKNELFRSLTEVEDINQDLENKETEYNEDQIEVKDGKEKITVSSPKISSNPHIFFNETSPLLLGKKTNKEEVVINIVHSNIEENKCGIM